MRSAGEVLVTIVTPVLEAVEDVANLLDNVSALKHLPVEHVVVDGGSRDGTLELLQRAACVDVLLGGGDRGISHALNRGIECASGRYVMVLNVDDRYDPAAFASFVGHLDSDRHVYYADVVQHDPVSDARFSRRAEVESIGRFMSVYHMALAVPRRVHAAVGGYREDYRLAMDSEFVHRCLAAGVPFERVPLTLGEMRLRGRSHVATAASLAEFERSAIEHGRQSKLAARWYRCRQTVFHTLLKTPWFQRLWSVVRTKLGRGHGATAARNWEGH